MSISVWFSGWVFGQCNVVVACPHCQLRSFIRSFVDVTGLRVHANTDTHNIERKHKHIIQRQRQRRRDWERLMKVWNVRCCIAVWKRGETVSVDWQWRPHNELCCNSMRSHTRRTGDHNCLCSVNSTHNSRYPSIRDCSVSHNSLKPVCEYIVTVDLETTLKNASETTFSTLLCLLV